jgi:hypothetical protein
VSVPGLSVTSNDWKTIGKSGAFIKAIPMLASYPGGELAKNQLATSRI